MVTSRIRHFLNIVLFCVAVAVPLRADTKPVPEKPKFAAVRVAKGPAIDGDLADVGWQNAPEITGFTQHNPDDGKPATQR